jgi:hypothetical protein
METKHTPGPWECTIDSHGRGRILGNGCWVATTWTVADDDNNKRYPAEANASLIAAAPDLLEACKQARAALPDAWFAEKNGVPRSVIDLLNSAIYKAEGK